MKRIEELLAKLPMPKPDYGRLEPVFRNARFVAAPQPNERQPWRHATASYTLSAQECELPDIALIPLIQQRRGEALERFMEMVADIYHHTTHKPGVGLYGEFLKPNPEDYRAVLLKGEWLPETALETPAGVEVHIDGTLAIEPVAVEAFA